MVIKPSRLHEFDGYAAQLFAHKAIYAAIESKTSVPWQLTAVLHLRESNANLGTYLGNGQSLKRKTTEVPENRGPFLGPNAFIDGAIDALRIDGLSSVKDLNIIEKQLFYTEQFNGWGSANKGVPSSYVWGGTSIQRPGKWVADHVWNGSVWDTQPGTAPILARLAALDHSIRWVRET